MPQKLLKFHLSCKKEHTDLLKNFNILYFGFGSKKNILAKMFPSAFQFDMNFYKISDIIFELNKKLKKNHKNLSDFSSNLILILIDFDFKYSSYFKKTNFRLIFTFEKMNKELNYQKFEDLNLVMRDLTTYEDYDVEFTEIKEDKKEGYLNVIRNGSKNSKFTFKNLLEFDNTNVSVNNLFDKIKKKLMIFKKNLVFNFLSEFIDHQMIKIIDHINIEILVEKKYFKDLINECEK
ncbi:origin recognition complex subunit 2 (ORC2) [Vairimorpha necatrix]|uniref:Origin recognition complex subunit 2 (ORC2) n=1 Tax=Vairimorpha necatrix TaxID=6039 RepID=A0AAX4JDQ2_9MICR